jgi:succinate-acetate transporter protein
MSKFFFYIQFVYIIFVLFAGIGYFFNSESISISVGLSGILAPFIAWFAGSGMREL